MRLMARDICAWSANPCSDAIAQSGVPAETICSIARRERNPEAWMQLGQLLGQRARRQFGKGQIIAGRTDLLAAKAALEKALKFDAHISEAAYNLKVVQEDLDLLSRGYTPAE
jgi:hypothetical protein